VQLDKTRIAVRERNVHETLDLALQVLRIYIWPLTLTMVLGAFPLAIVNHFLLRWMNPIDPDAPVSVEMSWGIVRYLWTMIVLVVLEAPLASAFVTSYLGKIVFVDKPRLRDVVREVVTMLPRLAWCHLLLRGVLPAIFLLVAVDQSPGFSGAETILILLFLVVLLRRATAPFLNEIILLERNPIRPVSPQAMTIRRRIVMLHSAGAGNLIYLALVVWLSSCLLALALFGTLLCVQGVFFDNWSLGSRIVLYGAPLAMWIAALFSAVVRFLSYLDLRIRHEGWEVELRMRAEGNRLAEQIS
jgi:hypothetical protein